MGLTILVYPKKDSQFKLADILWLFIGYALVHYPSDFISLWDLTKGRNEIVYHAGEILTCISYLFLFEFGRRLLGLSNIKIPGWLLPLLASVVLVLSLLWADTWVTLNILIGYFVRFPAGIMAGGGLLLYYAQNREPLEPYNVRRFFDIAGFALLAWGFFCGLIRAKGEFFPANILNIESFFLTFSIPVYVFRSICALLVAGGFIGILNIFNLEGRKRITEAQQREREAMTRHEKDRARIQTRDRIARNLHDEIGATISSITYFAEAISKDMHTSVGAESKKLLALIIDSSRDAQGELKDLIWTINPLNDSWDVLLVKFRRYASDLLDSKDIDYKIDMPTEVFLAPLEMERRQHLWLIFKEMVTNVAKHSRCGHAHIKISFSDGLVQLELSDDGTGFDTNISSDGQGLKNIFARAEKLNAKTEINSKPAAGTQWKLQFQVDQEH
jgi:signal transduction histidine kinase